MEIKKKNIYKCRGSNLRRILKNKDNTKDINLQIEMLKTLCEANLTIEYSCPKDEGNYKASYVFCLMSILCYSIY